MSLCLGCKVGGDSFTYYVMWGALWRGAGPRSYRCRHKPIRRARIWKMGS